MGGGVWLFQVIWIIVDSRGGWLSGQQGGLDMMQGDQVGEVVGRSRCAVGWGVAEKRLPDPWAAPKEP